MWTLLEAVALVLPVVAMLAVAVEVIASRRARSGSDGLVGRRPRR